MADERILKLVESSGFRYEVDVDGDVRMVLAWPDEDRSQFVFLDGNVDDYGTYADVDVWSPIVELDRFPNEASRDRAVWFALNAMAPTKFGSLTMRAGFLVVKADLPLSLEPDTFRSMAWAVAQRADELENIITDGGDDL